MYLPKIATLEQALTWIECQTKQPWSLTRLLEEACIKPWVWIDYSPEYPELFQNRFEGFLAPLLFAGDIHRLAAGAGDAVMTMTKIPDGRFVQIVGFKFPLSELRFKAEDLLQFSSKLSDSQGVSRESKTLNEMTPPEFWRNGLRLVAWEAALKITESGNPLTANGLYDAMAGDNRVTASTQKLHFSKHNAHLKRGEDEVQVTTLSNWTVALKKIMK